MVSCTAEGILAGLNEGQRQAVTLPPGPLLVLAGPGSGKTRTLTARAAYLIAARGVPPARLLCVTFTNKAAEEMRFRLEGLLGREAEDIWIHTFHAACLRILRKYGAAIGLPPDFVVADEALQETIWRRVIERRNLSLEQYPVYRLRDFVSYEKAALRDPTQSSSLVEEKPIDPLWAELAADYATSLRARQALDFDDLIGQAVRLLREQDAVRQELQRLLPHVLVDEYQDINRAQYEFLTLLCPPGADVMAVADDDQCIYEWRGARPQLVDDFIRRYHPRVIELSECYRCTETILYAAQNLIARQRSLQRTRFMHTSRGRGDSIHHYLFAEAEQERRWIARLIRRLVDELHYNYGDIAIFYRTHHLADDLEGYLGQQGIPLQRVRKEDFFDQPGAREVVRYLHLIRSLADDEGLLTALNFPQTLADELTVMQLQQLANLHGVSLAELARRAHAFPELSPLTRANLRSFLRLFEEELRPVSSQDIDLIIEKLFALLEQRRSPFDKEERRQWRIWAGSFTFPEEAKRLRDCLQAGERLKLTAPATLDGACAAVILEHTLQHYLDRPLDLELSTEARSLKLEAGDLKAELETWNLEPGTSCSVTAWRFAQDLLAAYEHLADGPFVVYDLETTGTNPRRDEIVEIGALVVRGGEPVGEAFYSKVRPGRGFIPKAATGVHGLRWEDVKDAEPIEVVLPRFLAYVGTGTVVGHNIEEFDNRFLDREADRLLGRGFRNPYLDTLSLARRLLSDGPEAPSSFSLESLLRYFGLGERVEHRAAGDVRQTAALFQCLLAENRLQTALRALPELLPLAALGLLATLTPGLSPTGRAEIDALLNGARRVMRRSGEITGLGRVQELLPQAGDELTSLVERLENEEPPPLVDEEWDRLREAFERQVEAFLRFSPDHSLSAFLDYQALVVNVDTFAHERQPDRVTLMTLHNAKGTEFPVVIIIGVEEENLPLWTTLQEGREEALAEERRVFYVGMTRAQQRLYLCSTRDRGDGFLRSPSRFAFELPPRYVRRFQIDRRGRMRRLKTPSRKCSSKH